MKRLHLFCFVIFVVINSNSISTALDILKVAKSLDRVNALIVVDVQNCFITGNLALSNSPAKQDGAEVVPIINNLIQTIAFDVIVYTHDWHPADHISFFENLRFRRQYLAGDRNRSVEMFEEVTYTGPKKATNQTLWPSHCVNGMDDAALHKNLFIPSTNISVIHIRKGIDSDIDSYSAFADNNRDQVTELNQKLRERNVTHVFVAGLATDYCVAATALDAFDLNYTTYLIEDASRGVNLITIKSKLDHLKQRGVVIIQANQVEALINNASNRSFDFIMILFLNVLILLFQK